MQENAKLVHRWFEEVWNQAREETINELFASDAVAYGLGETDVDVQGPAQFKTFFHNLRTTFPDIHITIEDTVADGDKVTVRLVLEGTHQGDGACLKRWANLRRPLGDLTRPLKPNRLQRLAAGVNSCPDTCLHATYIRDKQFQLDLMSA